MNKNIAITIFDITSPSGTERAVANLANLLTEYGNYNVSIVSLYSHDGGKCYYELNSKIKIKHLGIKKTNLFFRLYSYIKLIFLMRNFIKSNNINIIFGTTHAQNCLSIFYNKNVKKVACEHMGYDACPTISSFIRRICYKHLDKTVLLTRSDYKKYHFIEESKKCVIPNSLSFECKSPSTLDKKRIIAIGRLTYQKGFDILIKIAVLIKKDLPNWKIDIFGEGEDYINLIKMIHDYDLKDYVFINSTTQNIKKELLDSSIYVMSSRYEGLPMVLLEAKACGLPIVSFNCPEGPADVIVNGKDGFIIESNDINGFANKVVELAKSPFTLSSFGSVAYKNSQKYCAENIYKMWNTLLESL